MKFNLGDIVMIKPNTRYYNAKEDSNPSNMEGIISSISKDKYINVIWQNKLNNSYSESDLIRVTENSVTMKKFNKIINYKSTKETFPKEERIPDELVKENLMELGDDALEFATNQLLRYNRSLSYTESYIELLEEILKENINEIKKIAGIKTDSIKENKKSFDKITSPGLKAHLKVDTIVNDLGEIPSQYIKEPGEFDIPVSSYAVTIDPNFSDDDYYDDEEE